MASIITVLLIARFLTPAEQGYYYTFSSLVALQIVFELGFSFVILQLASHESAVLSISSDFRISGDPVSYARLASILQKAVRWYSFAALLMAAGVVPAGFYFFSRYHQFTGHISWGLPWLCVALAAVLTFQIDPVCSFLEGCGQVASIARMRFGQAVVSSLLAWSALVLHRGLFAPAMTIAGQAIVGVAFLATRRRLLWPLIRHRAGTHAVSWRREILPFQWRLAISWLSGYFIFQLFNPVLFAYRGAAEAGQMGMSLSIASSLSAVAIAWISTKAAPFGNMIARRDYPMLDKVFFRTLVQSSILLATGALTLMIGLATVRVYWPRLAARVLPTQVFAVLLATVLLNHVVFSEAIYLRAHKKEPFLPLSVLIGILTGASTLISGRYWGAAGVTLGYFVTSGVLGLVVGTLIFMSKRRAWHR